MRNDGFTSGILAGMALGALISMAMSPRMRRPMMSGMNEVGDRMRGMWQRGARTVEEMMPGDEH